MLKITLSLTTGVAYQECDYCWQVTVAKHRTSYCAWCSNKIPDIISIWKNENNIREKFHFSGEVYSVSMQNFKK